MRNKLKKFILLFIIQSLYIDKFTDIFVIVLFITKNTFMHKKFYFSTIKLFLLFYLSFFFFFFYLFQCVKIDQIRYINFDVATFKDVWPSVKVQGLL